MSRKPDDLHLDYIHQIAKGSSKVQELIIAKNKETIELQNKQHIQYRKPDMAPSPQGDIRLTKVHKQMTMDDKTLDERIEQNHTNFDNQIKQEMDKLVAHSDHTPVKNIVENMNAKDVSTLSEKGPHIYKQTQEIEEKNIDESLKFDFDDKNEFSDYNVYHDFIDNSKSMETQKTPSPSNDFE